VPMSVWLSTEMRWNWWKKSGPLAIFGMFHAVTMLWGGHVVD
jgi:hypothetical protein